jgi:hypothetical protein
MANRTPTQYTGTVTGQAGSLITALDAALVTGQGWTKQFSGTNKAVYKMAAGGTNCVLQVVDDGSVATAGAREATFRAAESATDVDTLVDAFPTVANIGATLAVVRKSDTADSTARNYRIVADGRYFHLWIQHAAGSSDSYCFGDYEPLDAADVYNCVIGFRGHANDSSSARFGAGATYNYGGSATPARMAVMRRANGVVKAEHASLIRRTAGTQFGDTSAATIGDYPGPSGKFFIAPVLFASHGQAAAALADNSEPRGFLPFLFEPLHGAGISSMAHADTFTDTAYGASSEFVVLGATAAITSSQGRLVLQTAGTWIGP